MSGRLGCAIAGAGREFWVAFGGNVTGNLVRGSFKTNSMASEELRLPLQCKTGTLAFVETPVCHTWLSGGGDGALRAAILGASSSGETACDNCMHILLRHTCLSHAGPCQRAFPNHTMCLLLLKSTRVHSQIACLSVCLGWCHPGHVQNLPQLQMPRLLRSDAWVGAARHGAPITAVAASLDGAFLFSGAADGSLFVHVRLPHLEGRAHGTPRRMLRWYAMQEVIVVLTSLCFACHIMDHVQPAT